MTATSVLHVLCIVACQATFSQLTVVKTDNLIALTVFMGGTFNIHTYSCNKHLDAAQFATEHSTVQQDVVVDFCSIFMITDTFV